MSDAVIHNLKCDPEPFDAVLLTIKPWEMRYNDRNYRVGDRVVLCETKLSHRDMLASGASVEYTGRTVPGRVTSIFSGYGLQPGWVILSIRWKHSCVKTCNFPLGGGYHVSTPTVQKSSLCCDD